MAVKNKERRLLKREWLVLRMSGGDMTNKEIARVLGYTINTIKYYKKTGVAFLRQYHGYTGLDDMDLYLYIEKGHLEWHSTE